MAISKLLSKSQDRFRFAETPIFQPNDAVVIVMGATGAGKSTFIQALAGKGHDVGIGHDLESSTTAVRVFPCEVSAPGERRLVLVDTPGFDDSTITYRSDADVLETIATWLAATYVHKLTLTAVLFFHRVTDNRMQGTSLKNLRMFQKLCGPQAFQNVILVTSMWDIVDPDIGNQREDELQRSPKFWQPLIQGGAKVARFGNSLESGKEVIEKLKDLSTTTLKIQVELVDEQKALVDTEAGKEVDANLVKIAEESRQILEALEREEATDLSGKQQIEEDKARYKQELENIKAEMRRLRKRSFWKKLGSDILRILKIGLRKPGVPVARQL